MNIRASAGLTYPTPTRVVAESRPPSVCTVACPHGEGFEATGSTPEKAVESLLFHLMDEHGAAIPESVKDHIRSCAFMLGSLAG